MAPAIDEEPAGATFPPAATVSGNTATDTPPQAATPAATAAPGATIGAEAAPSIYIRSGSRITAVGAARPQLIELQRGTEPSGVGAITTAPDGSSIAFTENSPGRIGLGLMDLRTSEQQFVADVLFGAAFSPDGQSVAYTVVTQSSSQLIAHDFGGGTPRVLQQGGGSRILRPIAWTPAGILAEEIIMATDAPPQNLVLIDPQAGAPRMLRAESHVQAESAPDGARVALVTGFVGMGVPGEAGLALVEVPGGGETELLAPRTGRIPFVRLSPDSSTIVYSSASSSEAPATLLHLIGADGSGGRTLDLGEAGLSGTLRDAVWRDDATLLVLADDGAGKLRLYELAAGDFSAGGLSEVGEFEQASPNEQAQILVAR
ncbi:MAG TPA: hypothetical protein VLA19_15780 [Herpetosiphonaceae bacterium]|nr:hypothetical protein [Herpetosiphonaceae bacterium]